MNIIFLVVYLTVIHNVYGGVLIQDKYKTFQQGKHKNYLH